MLGQNATHANFSVDDMDVAKSFYVDKLGLTIKQESPAGVMLETGAGTRINIYAKADHKAWDSTVLGIEVDDVKAAVDELKTLGVNVEKVNGSNEDGIVEDPGIGQAAWFKDPAGNWICVSSKA